MLNSHTSENNKTKSIYAEDIEMTLISNTEVNSATTPRHSGVTELVNKK